MPSILLNNPDSPCPTSPLANTQNTPYRVPRTDHTRDLAAYLGSTCLVVPWWAKWCTLGVEYHHLHHLAPQVPCYKLQVGVGLS